MSERLDILEADGTPAGRVKAKGDVHRDGDWHRAAHLWIVTADGRVLLQRRASVKESWPDRWDISVAGHVNAGETPIEAAVRETFEELGLRVAPGDLTHLGILRYQAVLNGGTYIENEFHDVFLIRMDIDVRSLVLDRAEVAEVALVALAELPAYEVVPHPESYELLRRAVETPSP